MAAVFHGASLEVERGGKVGSRLASGGRGTRAGRRTRTAGAVLAVPARAAKVHPCRGLALGGQDHTPHPLGAEATIPYPGKSWNPGALATAYTGQEFHVGMLAC